MRSHDGFYFNLLILGLTAVLAITTVLIYITAVRLWHMINAKKKKIKDRKGKVKVGKPKPKKMPRLPTGKKIKKTITKSIRGLKKTGKVTEGETRDKKVKAGAKHRKDKKKESHPDPGTGLEDSGVKSRSRRKDVATTKIDIEQE